MDKRHPSPTFRKAQILSQGLIDSTRLRLQSALAPNGLAATPEARHKELHGIHLRVTTPGTGMEKQVMFHGCDVGERYVLSVWVKGDFLWFCDVSKAIVFSMGEDRLCFLGVGALLFLLSP